MPAKQARVPQAIEWSPRNPEKTPTQYNLSTPILFTTSSLPFPLSTGHTSIHRRAILCQAQQPLTENHPTDLARAPATSARSLTCGTQYSRVIVFSDFATCLLDVLYDLDTIRIDKEVVPF